MTCSKNIYGGGYETYVHLLFIFNFVSHHSLDQISYRETQRQIILVEELKIQVDKEKKKLEAMLGHLKLRIQDGNNIPTSPPPLTPMKRKSEDIDEESFGKRICSSWDSNFKNFQSCHRPPFTYAELIRQVRFISLSLLITLNLQKKLNYL